MSTDLAPSRTQVGSQRDAARPVLPVQTLPVGAGRAWEVLAGLSGRAQVLYAVLLGASGAMAYTRDDSPVPWPGQVRCESRWARISMEVLADAMGCSMATVARGRRELEASGLVRVYSRGQRNANLYALTSGGTSC